MVLLFVYLVMKIQSQNSKMILLQRKKFGNFDLFCAKIDLHSSCRTMKRQVLMINEKLKIMKPIEGNILKRLSKTHPLVLSQEGKLALNMTY